MGMQDRDYYKDAWKKRDQGDLHGYHTGDVGRPQVRTSPPELSPWLIFAARFVWYSFLGFMVLRAVIYFIRAFL